jgi:hypothetical protein
MLSRLLLAGSLIAAGLVAATAQTTPPPAAAPGATVAPPVITDATHCRAADGTVRLKVGGTGAPATTRAASNSVPSSSPGTSSSVNNKSNMPGSNEAAANLSPC